MARKAESNIIPFVATIILGAIAVSVWFIRKVIRHGKVLEALISVPLVAWVYYLMYLDQTTPLWLWLIPALIFCLGWAFLFSLPVERGVISSNSCWADKNWWWTLDGWSFEEEVAKIFRLNGYDVEVTKKTGDGGVDLILWKDDMKTIVQCKHYKAPIPVAYVRELNGVREDYRAQRVIMVASSGASPQCYEFIRNKPYFDILDLDDIIEMGLRPSPHKP